MTKHQQFESILGESEGPRSPPLLPVHKPSSPQHHRGFFKSTSSLAYRRTAFILIAITSALLLINTAHVQYSLSSSVDQVFSKGPHHSGSEAGPHRGHKHDGSLHSEGEERPSDYMDSGEDEGDDEHDKVWNFVDDENGENEDEESSWDDPSNPPQRRPCCSSPHITHKAVEGVVSPQCPRLFLTTETSSDPPSYTSPLSSTSNFPSSSPTSAALLSPGDVACRPIPSKLSEYSLAFCISKRDCSQGFIQVVHDVPASDPMLRTKVSRNANHDQFFRHVAGPDDFYFQLEGTQKLALGAHLVSSNLLVDLNNTSDVTTSSTSLKLVYRADFRMVLPGPVQLSGWLTYRRFRAVRENKPGVWPEWTHALLIDPETKFDASDLATGAATKFTICPACEMDTFLDQLKEYREDHFEQCDRMAPVRGSYWREDLALRIYSELDTINRAPGDGAQFQFPSSTRTKDSEQKAPKLTRGWRFVPNGCTMTKTSSVPNAASRDPHVSACDSIASPAAMMRSPRFQNHNDTDAESNTYPRRRILFTGDSQVRTTYNAILAHYRPIDPDHQRFPHHDEYLPVLENNKTTRPRRTGTVIPHSATDTEIELIYKADQFLDTLVNSEDDELDRYDTIFLNLGQWPASGPVAGGQWPTAKLLERWEAVIERLNRWKRSREERMRARSLYSDEIAAKKNPTVGSGESSTVIWAGMNAFPMRTDPTIKVKGDWRTNARLGYWDDWIETISQESGGWFRRMNAWQLTFVSI